MGLAPLRSVALSALLCACGGGDDGAGGGDTADVDGAPGGGADGAPGGVDGSAADIDAGDAPPIDAAGAEVRIVFVTSTTHTGDLNGPDGADGICDDRAGEAGLTGTYMAWVSGATSAAARLAHFDGAYRRTDGVKVADSWDDLTDGSLDAPISRDEDGAAVSSDVWTGTTSSGAADTARCADFENGTVGASGVCGSSTATNGDWTDNLVPTCNTPLHVYCLQQ